MDLTRAFVELFPNGTPGHMRPDRNSFEMTGLVANTQPVNCTILYQKAAPSLPPSERQEYYLVSVGNLIFEFMICTAHLGSDYEEFASGSFFLDTAKVDAEKVAAYIDWRKKGIDSLCL